MALGTRRAWARRLCRSNSQAKLPGRQRWFQPGLFHLLAQVTGSHASLNPPFLAGNIEPVVPTGHECE